jgi:hypothetical protein
MGAVIGMTLSDRAADSNDGKKDDTGNRSGLKMIAARFRHIRVKSKQELKDRIIAAMDEFNRHPVVHTWSYKLDQAA